MAKRLVPSRRSTTGRYVAPRSALIPGAITRREWLNFLRHVESNGLCACRGDGFHKHLLWIGAKGRKGYGNVTWRGRTYKAHRVAFIALKGAITAGMVLDHQCQNASCVTPECLELVSTQANILRGTNPCANNKRKTHCIHGHPLIEENLNRKRWEEKGYRQCKTCERIKNNSRVNGGAAAIACSRAN